MASRMQIGRGLRGAAIRVDKDFVADRCVAMNRLDTRHETVEPVECRDDDADVEHVSSGAGVRTDYTSLAKCQHVMASIVVRVWTKVNGQSADDARPAGVPHPRVSRGACQAAPVLRRRWLLG